MALAIFAIAHSFAQEKEETPQEQEELLLTAKDSIPEELVLTAKDSIIVSSYMAGLGYNFVDDSGDVLDDFFLIEKEWNSVFFPSRINFGRYFESGIGLEAIARVLVILMPIILVVLVLMLLRVLECGSQTIGLLI